MKFDPLTAELLLHGSASLWYSEESFMVMLAPLSVNLYPFSFTESSSLCIIAFTFHINVKKNSWKIPCTTFSGPRQVSDVFLGDTVSSSRVEFKVKQKKIFEFVKAFLQNLTTTCS